MKRKRMKTAISPRNKNKTKQEYRTPLILLRAVERRFGPIRFDLAARTRDAVLGLPSYTPQDDALKQDWVSHHNPKNIPRPCGVLWLNPPFRKNGEFAEACAFYAAHARPGNVITMLVPASVDAKWWDDHVRGKAHVLALDPRVTFVGESEPYPRGLALCVYDPRYPVQSAAVERWCWMMNPDTGCPWEP